MINIESVTCKALEYEQLLLTKYNGELSLVTSVSFFAGMLLNSEIFSKHLQNIEGIDFHK